jgi:hypothetical protein
MQERYPDFDVEEHIAKALDTAPFITFEYLDTLEANLKTAMEELEVR